MKKKDPKKNVKLLMRKDKSVVTGLDMDLEQMLITIALSLPEGVDVFEWVSDPDWDLMNEHDADTRENVGFAMGFLAGVAACQEMTVAEFLDAR